MEDAQEVKPRKKIAKQQPTAQPYETLSVGQIEVSIWKGATATGIPFPQFTLSRTYVSGTGRQGASRYLIAENEAELIEAIKRGAERVRELRDEMAGVLTKVA